MPHRRTSVVRRVVALALCLAAAEALPRPLLAEAPPAAVDPVIGKIREEGLKHSQVSETLDYLCNVIGQRLTGSPAQQRASEWTRDTLQQWGLVNAHLEPWGPFGRGWSMDRFSIQLTAPYPLTLTACPKAWSTGFDKPMDLDLVYLDAHNRSDLEKYAGKLHGKAVLIGSIRAIDPHFDPQGFRLTPEALSALAAESGGKSELLVGGTAKPATRPAPEPAPPTSRPSGVSFGAAQMFAGQAMDFAVREGASVVIDGSRQGDGGTIFVASATMPLPSTRPTTQTTQPDQPERFQGRGFFNRPQRPKAYAPDAPPSPAQITLSGEDFNRLVHMVQHNQTVKLAIDLRVTFYPSEKVNTADTIAEIPGSDLKDQIVMVGGHLDSWQSGEGATDNAVGSACAMEAVRIIRALNLHPRRTIRIALWTGEEEGLLGSTAYVKNHFGEFPEERPMRRRGAQPSTARFSTTQISATQPSSQPSTQPSTRPTLGLVKGPEYEKLSVYFNLDNGTGKIRGIYAQNNSAAVPYFRSWLKPFADLDATTVTLANTGSTDHIPFDQIGLPGFQFIQDPIEYVTRTHHSNADVFERIQMDDMKQASTIMAAFLWDAANLDDRFPRKPLTAPRPGF